jgi:hypothetical protein
MSRGRQERNGVCNLTLSRGNFVDAHLIPKALTRPAAKGLPFIQAGEGTRPIRAWSSWHDNQLVTEQGEEILRDYDTWGIRELRRAKLVWSGWGPMQALLENHTPLPGTAWGVRVIECPEPSRLRLFFLSLLWRAAKSKRPEFSEISMPPEELESLRAMVVNQQPNPQSFYPIMLTQLSTVGPVHNQTPLAMMKEIPSIQGTEEHTIPIFRFYFDGLIVHFHRGTHDEGYPERLGPLLVGNDSKLAVSTVTYDTSFQKENIERVKLDAMRQWPELMRKL